MASVFSAQVSNRSTSPHSLSSNSQELWYSSHLEHNCELNMHISNRNCVLLITVQSMAHHSV